MYAPPSLNGRNPKLLTQISAFALLALLVISVTIAATSTTEVLRELDRPAATTNVSPSSHTTWPVRSETG